MFERFRAGDNVLNHEAFVKDEVQYNLIHFIGSCEDTLKIKSIAGDLIFTRTEGFNPWLWISGELASDQRKLMVQELVQYLNETEFPGITSEPETARLFAESYCQAKQIEFHTYMMLNAYHCPEVIPPRNINGHLLQATEAYTDTIAEFMAGFSEDAFDNPIGSESLLPQAEKAVRSGGLYLWVVDEAPVSMANIVHQTTRHGRINDVYTPRNHRKKGYASAIVAALCSQLIRRGVTPVLYADGKNPDSNKVYQSIGFVETGTVADIKFI